MPLTAIISRLACVILIMMTFLVVPTQSRAADPVTVGAFFLGLHGVINSAADQAQGLLDTGDAVAGQTIKLATEQMRYLLKQLEAIYNDQRNKTMSSIDATIRGNLLELEDVVNKSISNAKDGIGDSVFVAQAAANQLLNKLPFVNKDPYIVGIVNTGTKNHDLEVFGFNLVDAKLNRKPHIALAGFGEVADSDISMITDARLGITLSEATREKLGIGPTGCVQEEFKVFVTAFKKGWLLTKSFPFERSVEPCARRVEITGRAVFTSVPSSAKSRTNEVTISTGYIDARTLTRGPENRTRSLSMEIPDEARKVNAKTWWTKQGGNPKSKDAGSPVIGRGIVTARGRITGDSVLYGKGVWANYHLQVTYEIDSPGKPVQFIENLQTVLGESSSYLSLPNTQGQLSSLSLQFYDENSKTNRQIDVLEINSPPIQQNFTSTSKRGLFKATFAGSNVRVERSK